MSVKSWAAVAAAVLLLVALPSPGAAQRPLESAQSPHPVGAQVTYLKDGSVVAVNSERGTLTIRVSVEGQPQATSVVWVQKFTKIIMEEADRERVVQVGSLRPGDRVVIEGLSLDDGRLLALVVKAKRGLVARSADDTSASQPHRLKGVVTLRGRDSLVVVDIGGVKRQVRLTDAVRVAGQRASVTEIMPYDFVVLDGTLAQDGAFLAAAVEVVLAARKVITGRITAVGPGYVVIDGKTVVRVSADTLVLVNGELKSISELRVGSQISVSGMIEGSGADGPGAGGPGAGAASDVVGAVINLLGR